MLLGCYSMYAETFVSLQSPLIRTVLAYILKNRVRAIASVYARYCN